jgi:hypothetical protein
MQYRSGWGDTVKSSAAIIANLLQNYPVAKRQDAEWQREDDRRAALEGQKAEIYEATKHIMGGSGIEVPPPSSGETAEEYLAKVDKILTGYVRSHSMNEERINALYNHAKTWNKAGAREAAGGMNLQSQLQGSMGRFAPQQQLPEASPLPDNQLGRFGPMDSSAQAGNAPLGGPMAGLGLNRPPLSEPGLPMDLRRAESGNPSIIESMAGPPPQSQGGINRFEQGAGGRSGPDYTRGFTDSLQRLTEDVQSGRVNYREGAERRENIMAGMSKAQVANEEFDVKMREARLNALRKDLFAARGKNRILRRDTREEVTEFDSAEMWDNPENFILGEMISAEPDPLKQFDAETRRIAALNRGARRGGSGSRTGSNKREPNLEQELRAAEDSLRASMAANSAHEAKTQRGRIAQIRFALRLVADGYDAAEAKKVADRSGVDSYMVYDANDRSMFIDGHLNFANRAVSDVWTAAYENGLTPDVVFPRIVIGQLSDLGLTIGGRGGADLRGAFYDDIIGGMDRNAAKGFKESVPKDRIYDDFRAMAKLLEAGIKAGKIRVREDGSLIMNQE